MFAKKTFWAFPGYKGTNERLTGQVFEVSERERAGYKAKEEE